MLPCLDVIIINDISTAILNRSLCTYAHTTKDIYTHLLNVQADILLLETLGSFFNKLTFQT